MNADTDSAQTEYMSESAFHNLTSLGFERIPTFEYLFGYRAFTGADGTVEIARSYPRKWNVWVTLPNNTHEGTGRIYTLANDVPFAQARGIASYYVSSGTVVRSEMLRTSRVQEIVKHPGKAVNITASGQDAGEGE